MTQLNVMDLQQIAGQAPGETQTAWSTISWSKCDGPSALSQSNCGW
ncbi:hypothetical protein [Nocardia sp. NPDC003345]